VVGNDQDLTKVLRLDPIHVRLDFPQERLDEVAQGQEVEVVLDSFRKETFAGTVIRISPRVEPQFRVCPVVVEVKNPGNRIKAGVSGYARLKVNKKSLAVPATALIERERRAMVFRVEDGRARIREVVTGHRLDTGLVEVLRGLTSGDEVVVFHNFYRHAGELTRGDAYLKDDDLVDVDWRKWAGRE
jgi:RND family efflux transporter MFP subunit